MNSFIIIVIRFVCLHQVERHQQNYFSDDESTHPSWNYFPNPRRKKPSRSTPVKRHLLVGDRVVEHTRNRKREQGGILKVLSEVRCILRLDNGKNVERHINHIWKGGTNIPIQRQAEDDMYSDFDSDPRTSYCSGRRRIMNTLKGSKSRYQSPRGSSSWCDFKTTYPQSGPVKKIGDGPEHQIVLRMVTLLRREMFGTTRYRRVRAGPECAE